MKTTVKSRTGRAEVQPLPVSGEILLSIAASGLAAISLTPDEAGALLFGIEQALEALTVGQSARYAAKFERQGVAA